MPDDHGSIDELNESLYSRTAYHPPEDGRRPIADSGDRTLVEEKWNAPELDDILRYERRKPPGMSFAKKIFYGALIFCLLAAAAAGYIYINGGNFISSRNVDISVSGPTSVAAGDILNMTITISNTNNADIQNATLSIQYPDGSRSASDSTKALGVINMNIGSIGSGDQFSTTTSAMLFGEMGEVKSIAMTLEYTVKASNATFSKEKIYQVSIGTAPVSMTVTQPDGVTSGNVFTTKVAIVSNSTDVLKNVLVRGEYPYGFTVTGTNPATINSDQNLWSIGDLAPGESKTLSVSGTLVGQDQEQRTFRFSSGVAAPGDAQSFGTSLATTANTLTINRPNVDLELTLGGVSDNPYVAPAGKLVQGEIHYQNNMTDALRNAQVALKISGNAIDKFSVSASDGGFYDSANNQIVWNGNGNANLAALNPGDGGTLSFQFSSLANLPANQNQEIDLGATLTGAPTGAPQIVTTDTRTIKIGASVDLSAVTLYSKGPFKNSGPIPPQAEQATTYTLAFTLKDTQNDIQNATLTATLGPNIKWLGQTSPSDQMVSYDDTSKMMTWSLGTLTSGTGYNYVAKTLYVQVSVAPSTGQVGSVPILLQNISFKGSDAFTHQAVTVTAPMLTTLISTDPVYVQGDETVVK